MKQRRMHGKPLPAKRDVKAALDFYSLVKGKDMKLGKVEKWYLIRLVSADVQRMGTEMDHAACYGSEVTLPDYETAASVLEKLADEG